MNTAPITLFVFNRLVHTQKTIQSLQKNILAAESNLFIYADAPRNESDEDGVGHVRAYLRTITGFKSITIRHREKNLGVDEHIIQGVTEIVNEFGKIIVLEDDLVTSIWFLKYMNDALNFYENKPQVACIHGYLLPVKQKLNEVFFLKGADCWGWATWKHAWDLFEPDGLKLLKKIEEGGLQNEFDFKQTYPYTQALRDQAEGRVTCWDIRWYASAFLGNKLTLYPGKSMVNNIGHDNSGTHCFITDSYEVSISEIPVNIETEVVASAQAYQAFASFFRTLPGQNQRKKSWLSKSFKQIKALVLNK
jgi:hypothetical protein